MSSQDNEDTNRVVALLEGVMARLGFDGHLGLVRSWADYVATTNRHLVKQAFEKIKVHAVYGFASGNSDQSIKFSPILYFAVAHDDQHADTIHRLVWSQGVVPILLIATKTGLQVRKSLAPPAERSMSVAWERISDGERLPTELTSLTTIALQSSVVWNDYTVNRRSRVDSALLNAIQSLNGEVCSQFPQLASRPELVNNVIGRFIYFFVLYDRGIVTPSWVNQLKDVEGIHVCKEISKSLLHSGGIDSSDLQWPAHEVWALFDQIDNILNGSIFPITKSERRFIPSRVLDLIRRAIRHGDQVRCGTHQLGFLDVSFSTLRTETISAIYELFLFIVSPEGKQEDGAFYTPPFLVDYVLDEIDCIRPLTAKSRVLDPAAGSGIFLVGAYRRILERTMPHGRWKAVHFEKARKLLEGSIFGIERNPQAANVIKFSLYLTLLDYIDNADIEKLGKLVPRERVFPPLHGNIFDQDVFSISISGTDEVGRFTHVVGNPPWGTFGDRSDRTNKQRTKDEIERRQEALEPAKAFHVELDASRPVTNKRLSELFIWKIQRDFIESKGVMGILISTRSFVARTATSFPNALAGRMKLVGLSNLSHFRYKLFASARNPTLAIFAEAKESSPMDPVWVYSPLLTSQPIGQKGHIWSIIVSELDIEHYRLRDLTCEVDAWFKAFMLRPMDRRFASHLKLWSSRLNLTLADFVNRSGMSMGRGGSPSQTGLPDELLLGAKDYKKRLGLDGFGLRSYDHDQVKKSVSNQSFAKMFSGNIVLIPRHMNEVHFIQKPIAFVSSFNAIYSLEDDASDKKRTIALRAVERFLNSDVARYLYALFGKSWILDHARLEINDLGEIPFPYEQLQDPDLERIITLNERELTKHFMEKIGLDVSFVAAVHEYAEFRRGYEDAQIPGKGLHTPNDDIVSQYRAELVEQLSQKFGSKARINLEIIPPEEDGPVAHVDIHIARESAGRTFAGQIEETPPQFVKGKAAFSPHTSIVFDAPSSRVVLSKSWACVSWTIEQAFADARAVAEEVVRSGSCR